MELGEFKELLEQALAGEDIREILLGMLEKGPDNARDRAAQLEKQLTALEEKQKSLQEEFQRHIDSQEQEKERFNRLRGENEVLCAQNTGLQKHLETAKTDLEKRRQEAERLIGRLRETSRQVESLSQENAGLMDRIGSLNDQLEKEKSDWQNRLCSTEREKEDLEKKLRQIEEKHAPFLPLLEYYRSYRLLPEPLLRSLSPILPADDPIRFLVCGCQINSLLHLWDAVKLQLEMIPPEQVAVLTEILAFFLARYNSIWDTPVYELMMGEVGKPFDQQRHIRSSTCSLYQGNVQKVLFPGIRNLNRKIVERKCVVQF